MENKAEDQIKKEKTTEELSRTKTEEEKTAQHITIVKNELRFEDIQTFFQTYSLEKPIQSFLDHFENICNSFEVTEKKKIIFFNKIISTIPTEKEDMLLLLFAALGCIVSSSFGSEGKVLTERDLRPELDEDNHILVMHSWMRTEWKDEYLTWEPKEFNNITILSVPDSEVWKPDLSIYTSSSDDSVFPKSNFRADIHSDGRVLWVPAFTIKNRCPILKKQKTSYYNCSIRIGSWTYSSNLMDIQRIDDIVYLDIFQITNPKWILINAWTNRESKHYPCCVEEFHLINLNIELERRILKE
ncbi:neuronal acetylcholine receptor subunit alpha-4 [Trichonephila clavata]|uniref:Neuronal acetylcholine receptor subunit alpha-4 n=1 Tax=Trichonephila clavata TaxID=2740835 RepID=A0A8X6FYP6_TRICU|nr:neuronal acetylcholine receptor subunit alpha-4 [Trichonephila clavata]